METISFDSSGTRCDAWYLRAQSDALTRMRGRPCVVMAPGFGNTRDSGLLPFAERFAAIGCDVLLFDYRGFGTSDGAPRQDVDHIKHRQDYHAAVAAARRRDGVDDRAIVLWGVSYSGGHVVAVAAGDPKIAAVVAQSPAMDAAIALADFAKASPLESTRKTLAGLRDAGQALARAEPLLIPIAGLPGSDAMLTAPGTLEGYQRIAGPTFRNEMLARGGLRLPFNRPVALAARVRCPLLVVVSEQDELVPTRAMHEAAARAPRATVASFPCGHFGFYGSEFFEASVAVQCDFLTRHLR